MPGSERGNTNVDRAARSAPAFLFWGCMGGLLLGVIFGNIPYGLLAGMVLAPIALAISLGRRGNR